MEKKGVALVRPLKKMSGVAPAQNARRGLSEWVNHKSEDHPGRLALAVAPVALRLRRGGGGARCTPGLAPGGWNEDLVKRDRFCLFCASVLNFQYQKVSAEK